MKIEKSFQIKFSIKTEYLTCKTWTCCLQFEMSIEYKHRKTKKRHAAGWQI